MPLNKHFLQVKRKSLFVLIYKDEFHEKVQQAFETFYAVCHIAPKRVPPSADGGMHTSTSFAGGGQLVKKALPQGVPAAATAGIK